MQITFVGDFTEPRMHPERGTIKPVWVGEYIITYRASGGEEYVTHKEHWQSLPFVNVEAHEG